jgi:hypothetical protein
MFICRVAPPVLSLLSAWLTGVGGSGDPWLDALGRVGSSIWVSLLYTAGLVTAIFAVGERVAARTKPKGDWDPLKLPPVRDTLAIPRSSSIFDLVLPVLVLAFWARYLGFQSDFNTLGARIRLNPYWGYFVGGFMIVILGQAVLRDAIMAGSTKATTSGMDAVNAGISNIFPLAIMVCVIIVLVDVRRLIRAGKKDSGGRPVGT